MLEYTFDSGDGISTSDEFQTFIDSVPSESKIFVKGTIKCDTPIQINKPISIYDGIFIGSESIVVSSSDVHLESITVRDSNKKLLSGKSAVSIYGPNGYIKNVSIHKCKVHNVGYNAVRVRYAENVNITNNIIENYRYAGVAIGVANYVKVHNNYIRNGESNSTVNHNAYGIYASSSSTAGVVSNNIDISHNYVENIPHWEGIDTHNGHNIKVTNNVVKGCRRGIAIVTVRNDDPNVRPKNVVVSNNSVDGTGKSNLYFEQNIGIVFGGRTTNKLDGVVTNNYIESYDDPIAFHPYDYDRYNGPVYVHSNIIRDTPTKPPNTNVWDSGYVDPGEYFVLKNKYGNTLKINGAMSRHVVTPHGFSIELVGKFLPRNIDLKLKEEYLSYVDYNIVGYYIEKDGTRHDVTLKYDGSVEVPIDKNEYGRIELLIRNR